MREFTHKKIKGKMKKKNRINNKHLLIRTHLAV